MDHRRGPLEWCLQPGVKLDFRHLPMVMWRPPRMSKPRLKRIGHTLSPLEIVVVNTSAGRNTAKRIRHFRLRHGL